MKRIGHFPERFLPIVALLLSSAYDFELLLLLFLTYLSPSYLYHYNYNPRFFFVYFFYFFIINLEFLLYFSLNIQIFNSYPFYYNVQNVPRPWNFKKLLRNPPKHVVYNSFYNHNKEIFTENLVSFFTTAVNFFLKTAMYSI